MALISTTGSSKESTRASAIVVLKVLSPWTHTITIGRSGLAAFIFCASEIAFSGRNRVAKHYSVEALP